MSGEPNVKNDAYTKPTLTRSVWIPNLRAHHSHTPNDRISKKNVSFFIQRINRFYTKLSISRQWFILPEVFSHLSDIGGIFCVCNIRYTIL
jgi:hypothetical protein